MPSLSQPAIVGERARAQLGRGEAGRDGGRRRMQLRSPAAVDAGREQGVRRPVEPEVQRLAVRRAHLRSGGAAMAPARCADDSVRQAPPSPSKSSFDVSGAHRSRASRPTPPRSWSSTWSWSSSSTRSWSAPTTTVVSAGTTACWSGRVITMTPTTAAAAAARTAGATIHSRRRLAPRSSSSWTSPSARQRGLGGRGGGGGVAQAGAGVAEASIEIVHDVASFLVSGVQLLGERRPGTGEVRLDGPLRAAEHGGDLGHRAVLDVVQGDRPALLLGQLADQPPQLGVGGRRHVAGASLGRGAHPAQRGHLPAAPPADVGRGVEGHPPDPRPGPVERGDPCPVLLRLGQRLLGEVLGTLAVAGDGVQHRHEPRVLVAEESLERHHPVTCRDHHLPSHTARASPVDSKASFVSGDPAL